MNGRAMLKDTFELGEDKGDLLKIYKSCFAPPEVTEKVQVVILEAFSKTLNPNAEDVQKLPAELQSPLCNALNKKLINFRKEPIKLMRMLLWYIIGGGLLCCLLAILFGVYVSPIIAIVLASLYFIGLIVIVQIHSRRNKQMEVRLIFNMGLVLANLNFNKGEVYPDQCLIQKGYRL
jgi:hypothetical protein